MSNLAKNWQEGTYTVQVVGKEVEISTIRSIKKEGLFGSCACAKRYVAHACCSSEDEFNLSVGVALAMDRLNKELREELGEDKIEVGDKVRIKNCGKSYTTYASWIKKNIDDVGLAACFAYSRVPNEDDTVYVVKAIAPWGTGRKGDKMLAYVQEYYVYSNDRVNDNECCYLMEVDGLEKV